MHVETRLCREYGLDPDNAQALLQVAEVGIAGKEASTEDLTCDVENELPECLWAWAGEITERVVVLLGDAERSVHV